MVRSHREIVEEKLRTASTLDPGSRDILIVRTNLMLVDVLEMVNSTLETINENVIEMMRRADPDGPSGWRPVELDYPPTADDHDE